MARSVAAAAQRTPLFALMAANALSFTAEALALVAIPWFVLDLTGSYARMGLIGFFTFLPRVIATFLGGGVIDRMGLRNASVIADVLSGISVFGIPLLYGMGHLSFTWLVVLVVIGAFFDGPGATAKDSMVTELAEAAQMPLDRVAAWFQGARRLAMLIGPALAGFLIALVGTSNVLWVNAVVFALSALLVLFLVPAIRVPEMADAPRSYRDDLLFGIRFLRRQRLMFWLAGIICLMNFLDAPLATVELPALVKEHYGDAAQVGIMLSVEGAGAVLGALVYSMVAPRLSRRHTFITSFGVVCAGFFLLAVAPPFALVLGVMFLIGIGSGPLNPILMTVRQERVPLAYRARVFGTTTAIAYVAIPLGQLVGGFLVEAFGPRAVIAGVDAVYFVAVAAMVIHPVLHEMDTPPSPEPAIS